MMFYNGFNLLIDLIIGSLVWFLTYKAAWWRGYSEGREDAEASSAYIYDSPSNLFTEELS